MAQIANGYYRVQNNQSNRYIILVDNKAKPVPATSTKPDLLALRTMSPFSKVVDDPGSIYYIQHISGYQYNLLSQGADAHAFAGRYLNVRPKTSNTYYAWGTAGGVDVYLYDEDSYEPDGVILTGGDEEYRRWKVLPLDASGDNYFGLTPDVTAGGVRYTSLYASFPYSFASSGMKAYAVTRIEGDMAIWQEVTGSVAKSTPLIIACAGATASNNRLNILSSGGTTPSGNLLKGVYFNTNEFESIMPIYDTDYHFNATPYDPATMRLLGVTSEGKLGFVKSNVQYLPKNKAYLVVPAGSPDELTLVTQAEYDAYIAADAVTVTADDKSKVYGDALPQLTYTVSGTGTLKGQPALSTTATQQSPVGNYPITVAKGTVTNRQFTAVNGTLSITKAMLSVKARSYTIKQNEPLPDFVADITGFKLGQSASVLTTQPQISCDVPADKTPGTYTINVSGASAQNYDFTYTSGTLTIQPADPITITANSIERFYGDANPELTYTVSGGSVSGTPVLRCEAVAGSPVGEYAITIEAGTISYPNLVLVPGKLTVKAATVTVTAGSYTMKQTDPRPAFEVTFSGWKNGETEAVLTAQPVLTTDAPDDNTPGEYVINVSGAAAPNYVFNYVPGKLTILQADPITIIANSFERLYGDENPELTYVISQPDIEGTPVLHCEAVPGSPVGEYVITVEAGTINYPNLVLVPGSLKVRPATVTVNAGTYTMKQTDPRPTFVATYSGWKNGEDEAVLTAQPVFATTAPDDNAPGEYEVTVSGAEASNYLFTYVPGKLIIFEADEVVVYAHDVTMVYGDPVPPLAYSIEGDAVIEGEPVITCEATPQSPVGTYTISVARGTITWPNVRFVDATLTVTRAPLIVSVDSFTIVQFDELPEFVIHYDGFRNGDDVSVLTELPTVTCDATSESEAGIYPIVVSGGKAQNYELSYQDGQLVITVNVGVTAVRFTTPVDVYTVTGRLVRRGTTTTSGLPRGIYVVNGRKLIVK